MQRGLSIGGLAEQTNSSVETIRYYERIGLLPEPAREGRYRSYGAADVSRLGFIRRARELGFGLGDIRALLGLADGGRASCGDVQALAAAHLADIGARIADLRRMQQALAKGLRLCATPAAANRAACPIIDSLQAADPRAPARRRRAERPRRK